MKLSFRQRLFSYFTLLFAVFTIGVALLEQYRERNFKTEALEQKLEVYADMIQASIGLNEQQWSLDIQKSRIVLPLVLRISVIDFNGTVLYDNVVGDVQKMNNHLGRKEIETASYYGFGTDIRQSVSNQHPYLYFAKKYENRFVRVALPYDIQLQKFLKSDNLFLYFLLTLFIISLLFIHRITLQFGNSISKLHRLALKPTAQEIEFDSDELGEIGNKILDNFYQLEMHKRNLQVEKQKLLQHISISEEGICFISSIHEVIFHNGLFIQYLNQLTDEPLSNINAVFSEDIFQSLHLFINEGKEKYFESIIKKHGKIFSIRANKFEDRSFEIILSDITQREKTNQLKKEMTGNIAHELRTPVTSIRAYLETVLERSLPEDKRRHFIAQAYHQTLSLSEIIKDVGIIAKMEEAPNSFELELVNVPKLLEQLKTEEAEKLIQNNIELIWQIPENLLIRGNRILLIAIFRNLIENSIRYAGENIKIFVSLRKVDNDFYYFTYYDTGQGIANEDQMKRIFERFYRIQEGRTRDTGGSGLGLSIVKNAVLFHKGYITAKNRNEGGLEVNFMLGKL